MTYSFHPLARKELTETIVYYNECQKGLGIRFANEIYKTIQIILRFPQAWSPLSKNTRRCITKRFPYGIVYQALENEVIIIAIMQLNRKPGYWHNRMK